MDKKTGRPTKYEAHHPELVFWMAQAGMTEKGIAEKMGIALSTLSLWKTEHPEFSDALERGKSTSDDEVEAALLRKAKGFEYQDGDKTRTALPDIRACIFWLKNRRPAEWNDKQEEQDIPPAPPMEDLSHLTNEEIEERMSILDKAIRIVEEAEGAGDG